MARKIVVKINELSKPKIGAAIATVRDEHNSIFLSRDGKIGYLLQSEVAEVGDVVTITEGPKKVIGKGEVIGLFGDTVGWKTIRERYEKEDSNG